MRFEYGDYEELKPEISNTVIPSTMSDLRGLLTNTAYAMGGSAALAGYKRDELVEEPKYFGVSDLTARLPDVRSALSSAKLNMRFEGRSYLHWRNRLGQGGPAVKVVDSWNLGYSDDEDECGIVHPNGIVMADTVHDALRKRYTVLKKITLFLANWCRCRIPQECIWRLRSFDLPSWAIPTSFREQPN